MTFLKTANGDIGQDFLNSVSEAFGLGGNSGVKNKGPNGFKNYDPVGDGDAILFGVAPELAPERWTGNSNKARSVWYRYGFAILDAAGGNLKVFKDPYFLDIPPQNIQQKEIFSTHVQATRKGVIVESEGVVFKDIVISGTTGVFPAQRGGSNTASAVSFLGPPQPPTGVDPETGRSKRNGVPELSGYDEFIRLRQFFLLYAKMKVETKGEVFFAFINEKDSVDLVCEPLEFVMERSARNPLNYNYRIVLKAIAPLSQLVGLRSSAEELGIIEGISNLSANISAAIASASEAINATTNLLVGITQALDNIFLTPMRQLNIALESISTGASRVLGLPATLIGNAESINQNRLAVAKKLGSIPAIVKGNVQRKDPAGVAAADVVNTSPFSSKTAENTAAFIEESNAAKDADVDEQGNVTGTSAADSKSTGLNLIGPDGELKETLTPQEYSAAKEIENQLNNDPIVPLPRSFVTTLKENTTNIINDLSDSIGLGSDTYSEILGRTVTHPAPPLVTPTDEQIALLGTLQAISSELNKILSNNEFFQVGGDEIYAKAQETYGLVASIRQPDSAREIIIEPGDSLERIALREYGDALRWVDLVILNNLKSPYISTGENLPTGVKKPGDKILVGDF